jgi:CheY-like chemotaxis protein
MSPPPRNYLIVDDNSAFAENLAEILEDSGAKAVVAASGEGAVKAVRRQRFSAVITDMRMPVMSGARVVHELRQVDPGLPALVMTAYTGDHDLEAARHEGLLAVLPKPIPIPQLLSLLSQAKRNGLVALVEDDEAIRDNLSEALRSRGFTAVLAGSITEAGNLGCVRPFAAAVDMRLPDGPDGEAMRRLEAKFPGIPMIVISAHTDVSPPIKHEAYFRKPFSTEELLSTLEALHRRSAA